MSNQSCMPLVATTFLLLTAQLKGLLILTGQSFMPVLVTGLRNGRRGLILRVGTNSRLILEPMTRPHQHRHRRTAALRVGA